MLVHTRARTWPGSRPVDAAYLSYVIEHVADLLTLLRELHRVIKPAGKLLLTTHNVNSIWRYVFGQYWINWHTLPTSQCDHAYAHIRLLMSMRAARDSIRGAPPHRRLYEPVSPNVRRRLNLLLRLEQGRVEGDCTIGIFERTR